MPRTRRPVRPRRGSGAGAPGGTPSPRPAGGGVRTDRSRSRRARRGPPAVRHHAARAGRRAPSARDDSRASRPFLTRAPVARPCRGAAVFTVRRVAGTIRRMIGRALDAGFRLLAGAVGYATGVIEHVGGRLLAPLRGAAPRPGERAEAATPQVRVEEAKYYLGRTMETPASAVVDREAGALPRAYGRDRFVLLPRDPWTAFAYWEVTPTIRVQALRALGSEAEGAREVLRVYDVTFLTFTGDNAWLSFDVEFPGGADHWYLNLGRPGASFCAEIGLRTPGGRFLPLARSNTIATPRAAPSPDK